MKCNATFPAVISDSATRAPCNGRRPTKVNKRLRTWFFPVGEEPEIGDHPEPDLWGVPNSFFTLNEKWCHGTHRIHQLQSVLIYVINGFVQNWTNYVYQTLFGKWLKDVEGSREHLLRCTAAHFKNMRMVFDTTFCGDFPASSVQLFKHAMKIYEKDEHVANFWKHGLSEGLSFPDSGDYAGASFNTYCGWTHMQCEAYVRSKPNDFRRWDCSSWVESNWYVMRSSWAGAWNINLWKVATQSDNQFGWFDMIFHGCFRHSCQIRYLLVLGSGSSCFWSTSLCSEPNLPHSRQCLLGHSTFGVSAGKFQAEGSVEEGKGLSPTSSKFGVSYMQKHSWIVQYNPYGQSDSYDYRWRNVTNTVRKYACDAYLCVYINHYYVWARNTLHRIQLHMYAYINICTRNT